MNIKIVRTGVAALALGGVLAGAAAVPAQADTTTTRNIIYGVAAVAAAATAYNVAHKHVLATTVQGYLPDGAVVYRDGRVVEPNGQSWYPGNNGVTVACNGQYCTTNGNNGYGYGYNNGYNNNGYGYNNSGYGYNNSGYNNGGYYQSNARRGEQRGRGRGDHGR